jgi:hypothetical protein
MVAGSGAPIRFIGYEAISILDLRAALKLKIILQSAVRQPRWLRTPSLKFEILRHKTGTGAPFSYRIKRSLTCKLLSHPITNTG